MSETDKGIVITLPWPHKALSPNARVHWGAKSRAVKKARNDAWLAGRCATGPKWRPLETAKVQVTFYSPVNRRRDGDNHLAACKAYFDGLVDAGIVKNDAGFTHEPVEFRHGDDKRIEIRIRAY